MHLSIQYLGVALYVKRTYSPSPQYSIDYMFTDVVPYSGIETLKLWPLGSLRHAELLYRAGVIFGS